MKPWHKLKFLICKTESKSGEEQEGMSGETLKELEPDIEKMG